MTDETVVIPDEAGTEAITRTGRPGRRDRTVGVEPTLEIDWFAVPFRDTAGDEGKTALPAILRWRVSSMDTGTQR
jgi:hypothetical protein